jgi:hypothetical protein
VNDWALKQEYTTTSKRTLKSQRGKESYAKYTFSATVVEDVRASQRVSRAAPAAAPLPKKMQTRSVILNNHSSFLSALAHPVHRKMDTETRNEVRNLSRQPIKLGDYDSSASMLPTKLLQCLIEHMTRAMSHGEMYTMRGYGFGGSNLGYIRLP